MNQQLLDDDLLRDGFTKLFLAWKEYEKEVENRMAELQHEINTLSTRLSLLEYKAQRKPDDVGIKDE